MTSPRVLKVDFKTGRIAPVEFENLKDDIARNAKEAADRRTLSRFKSDVALRAKEAEAITQSPHAVRDALADLHQAWAKECDLRNQDMADLAAIGGRDDS